MADVVRFVRRAPVTIESPADPLQAALDRALMASAHASRQVADLMHQVAVLAERVDGLTREKVQCCDSKSACLTCAP